jgi:hypothetical protein
MRNRLSITYSFVLVLLTVGTAQLFAQQSTEDLNARYRFPASLGASYQPLSGITNRALGDFNINEISGHLRVPIGPLPVLQPFLRGGVIQYGFLPGPEESNQDWTHSHFFGGLGMGFSSRLSREFEVGAEVFGGASLSYFPNLNLPGTPEGQSLGQTNLVAGAGVKIALNPSYNFSLSLSPAARYTHGLGELSSYDGLSFGIGLSASYRFGVDPDSAQSEIRAIRFAEANVPTLFAAMQSYYAQNPMGSVTIENTERYDLEDVEVAFMQAGYMDTPTPAKSIPSLPAGSSESIDLFATFNGNVFETEGITPLNGEVIVSYTARGRPVEQRYAISYELHDKNALTWDDDRKVAAFITPSDSAVRNYASHVRRIHRDVTNEFISEPLQYAAQAYNALAEIGILYQPDPTSPFTQVQENTVAVDSINLPRETLTRLTGDCDDITVLFNTMLESVGFETAFVTTPGHIYSAVNTGVAAADFGRVHPDRDLLLEVDGEIWVLVEITLIGRATFMEAWTTGISEFRQYADQTDLRGFYPTSPAQQVFRPVALTQTDLGLQYGDSDAIVSRFEQDFQTMSRSILSPFERQAREQDTERAWNRFGIMAAQVGNFDVARGAFENALSRDRRYLNAQLNLGSVLYLDENFTNALATFEEAERTIAGERRVRSSTELKVFLNLSKTHYELENFDEAREYFSRAEEVDEQEVARYSYLGSVSDTGGARASEAGGEPILFFDEELSPAEEQENE